MKILFLFFVILISGCKKQGQIDDEVSLLRLGELIQNSSWRKIEKVDVLYSWSNILSFKSQNMYCLLLKKSLNKKYSMRLVRKIDSGCSFFNRDIFAQWSGVQRVEISSIRRGLHFYYEKGLVKKDFNWIYLQSQVKNTYFRQNMMCGLKNQKACYRGRFYKKNVVTSCSDHNEQYFCSEGTSLYCHAGTLMCL